MEDFMLPGEGEGDTHLASCVETILRKADRLSPSQVHDLMTILTHYSDDSDSFQYGADFDLKEEITAQIRAVRALRGKVLLPSGQLHPDIEPREAKEIITTGSTLISTLMKYHEQIVNMDRQQAVETAIIDTVKLLNQKYQEIFFDKMKENLERIK